MTVCQWHVQAVVDGMIINDSAGTLKTTARQIARLGLLYLNRGRWGQLESRISGHRPDAPSWSKDNKEVWIVLGPIYAEARTPLPSRVAVPSHCFMIVLDEDEETAALRALAFMMPNAEQVDGNLEDYLTSIDEIELHTGLDFFWELEDPIETVLEMETAEQLWPVSSN